MTPPGGDERLLTAPMVGIALGSILSPLNSTMLAVALPSVRASSGYSVAWMPP